MINMNNVISNNIINIMKENNKKQIDMAEFLGVSKQTVNKMLNGSRVISAMELKQIAEFLNTTMEYLVKLPSVSNETNSVKAFMGKVESDSARQCLKLADEIADMICFYTRLESNSKEMMKPLDDWKV